VPRNGFVGGPVTALICVLQERIPLGGRRSIDGIFELFNLFNRAHYGSYVTDEASSQVGRPEYNANLAYAPRTVQLGFRLTSDPPPIGKSDGVYRRALAARGATTVHEPCRLRSRRTHPLPRSQRLESIAASQLV
jgi:hypothetical protein